MTVHMCLDHRKEACVALADTWKARDGRMLSEKNPGGG